MLKKFMQALFIATALIASPALSYDKSPIFLAQADGMTEGEVRKIDPETQKITIKHGPIAKYDMAGMTMVFRVSDPTMLNKVAVGDKIIFDIEKTGGAMVVVSLQKMN